MVCTSAYGRLISVMLMILSIFVLALPIAVIGQILTEEMENYVERKAQKETRVAKQIGVDESSDLLKKYSSTIERRKSQFNFELPNEIKMANEKRELMLVKMKSANDVLKKSAVSFDESKPSPILKRATTFSTPDQKSDEQPEANINRSSSASKLFSSWGTVDEDNSIDSSTGTPLEDPPQSDDHELNHDTEHDHDDDDNDNDGALTKSKSQVGFVLGSSSSPTHHSPPTESSSKRKEKSKAETQWNDKKKNQKKKMDQSLTTSSNSTSPSVVSNPNRKNPMLRPTTAKKMVSVLDSTRSLSPKKSQGRGTLARSHSSKIRDIDQELRILERNYLKQMLQCTELHNQIVFLMKEKNESLHEALL